MRWGRVAEPRETYRCSGCGLRWSYEAVRFVALCPECASGLVCVSSPEVSRGGRSAVSVRSRRASGAPLPP